ncbi:PQQ-binding-like beta-propeller repeat protein [Paenibacillus sp. 2TAF8]|uniref:outer membrane protein assembly factor BamB family protein n=1 Tax=Paenibacillus sp. 2TAF8 TaxID=3233020 RepID=UPI003F95BAAF
MKKRIFSLLIIFSLCCSLIAVPSHADTVLPEAEWVQRLQGRPAISKPIFTVDSKGNETIIIRPKDYILEGINAKTGKKKWEKNVKGKIVKYAEDGYISWYDYDKKIGNITVIDPTTGKDKWTAPLPSYRGNVSGYIYPSTGGSVYVVVSEYFEHKSSIYYYDKNGKRSKLYTLPVEFSDINKGYLFGYNNDYPKSTYTVFNLLSGKKIFSIKENTWINDYDHYKTGQVNGHRPAIILSGGTIITQYYDDNNRILKGYSPSGKLKWTKKVPFTNRSNDDLIVYTLNNNFLMVGGAENLFNLYNHNGELIGSQEFDSKDDHSSRMYGKMIVSYDYKSLMFSTYKDNKYEAYLLDTNNLSTLFYTTEQIEVVAPLQNFAFLNKKNELYAFRTAKYDLYKYILR